MGSHQTDTVRGYIRAYGERFILSTHNLEQYCAAVEELIFEKPNLTKLFALRLPMSWQYRLVALRTHLGADLLSTLFPLRNKRAVVAAIAAVWETPGHLIPCDLQRHRDFERRYFAAFPDRTEHFSDLFDFEPPARPDYGPAGHTGEDGDFADGLFDTYEEVSRLCDNYPHWRASVEEAPRPLNLDALQAELEAVKQRTPIWHLLRRLGVGGSTLAYILGFYDGDSSPPSKRELDLEHVARLVLGFENGEKTFPDMVKTAIRFGSVFEDMNDAGTECLLNLETDASVRLQSQAVGMRILDYCPDFMILSPDTLYVDSETGERLGGGEFKCPYLAKGAYPGIPSKYYGQVINTALALNVPWCVFSAMWARTLPGGHITSQIAVPETEVEMTTMRVWVNTSDTWEYFAKYLIAFAYYTQLVGAELWNKANGATTFARKIADVKKSVYTHLQGLRIDVQTFFRNKLRPQYVHVDLSATRGDSVEGTSDKHYKTSKTPLQRTRVDLASEFFGGNEELIDRWMGKPSAISEWNRPEEPSNHLPHETCAKFNTEEYYNQTYNNMLLICPDAEAWFRKPLPQAKQRVAKKTGTAVPRK